MLNLFFLPFFSFSPFFPFFFPLRAPLLLWAKPWTASSSSHFPAFQALLDCQIARIARLLDCWIAGLPDCWIAWIARIARIARLPDCWIAELQDCMIVLCAYIIYIWLSYLQLYCCLLACLWAWIIG